MFSPLEQFDAISFFKVFQSSFLSTWVPIIFQIPFLSTLIPFILLIFVFSIFVYNLKFNLKLVPNSIQRMFELLIEFIFNLIKQQIGKDGYTYFPFIFTLFNFILISNLLSLIPFGIALTSHVIMTAYLSLSICFSIFIIGLYIHNIQFLKIFIPECPIILLPMLILIEIFSYIIRAFSLAIRLSAI